MSLERSVAEAPQVSAETCLVPGSYLAAYVDAAKRVDLEPYRHLRQAGMPDSGFDDERVCVPHDRFIALVQGSARVARRPDFALLVAEALDLKALGASGILASAQRTLREALEVLSRHSRNPQRKLGAYLQEFPDRTVLRLTANERSSPLSAEAAVIAMGLALRAGQGLIGDDWRPRLVTFSHAAPRDSAPYRALFGDVLFDQPFDTMTLDAADLDRPIPTANTALARLASAYLDKLTQTRGAPFQDQVLDLISVLLPKGLCTVERVADQLGVDRRTVHRRLGESGVSFSELVQRTRKSQVERELRDQSLAELSRALGFSGVSAFSRWFRQTYGVTATRFRKAA